jgi:hypothetical protein
MNDQFMLLTQSTDVLAKQELNISVERKALEFSVNKISLIKRG